MWKILKFFLLTSYVGKYIKMSIVDFLEMECCYKLDIMAGTRESMIDKVEILLP